jgi:hypothetical protein
MFQLVPAPRQISPSPTTKPSWLAFCLGLLTPTTTRRGLDVLQPPYESDVLVAGIRLGSTNRRQMRAAHKVWTRTDGFTLSGGRRI